MRKKLKKIEKAPFTFDNANLVVNRQTGEAWDRLGEGDEAADTELDVGKELLEQVPASIHINPRYLVDLHVFLCRDGTQGPKHLLPQRLLLLCAKLAGFLNLCSGEHRCSAGSHQVFLIEGSKCA